MKKLKKMKKLKSTLLLVVIASMFTMFSCTKEGKQGPAGPAGANGINGNDGINGNANVSSATYTGNWINQGGGEWDVTLNIPTITSTVLNSGSINTYLSADGGQSWIALPTYANPVSMLVVYQVSTVGIAAVGGTSAPTATLFKVVIIPSSARIANPNIDYTNYYEVKGAFNLED